MRAVDTNKYGIHVPVVLYEFIGIRDTCVDGVLISSIGDAGLVVRHATCRRCFSRFYYLGPCIETYACQPVVTIVVSSDCLVKYSHSHLLNCYLGHIELRVGSSDVCSGLRRWSGTTHVWPSMTIRTRLSCRGWSTVWIWLWGDTFGIGLENPYNWLPSYFCYVGPSSVSRARTGGSPSNPRTLITLDVV